MATVRKSVIVPRPAEALFELVDRCERYPEFLPWCSAVDLLSRDDAVTHARLHIDYRGLRTHVETRNAKAFPDEIRMELVDGPFERFEGLWRFAPLGEEGCRVELALDYAFSSRALEALMGTVFGHIAGTLVDRFVARAEGRA